MKFLPLLWAGIWRKPSRAVLLLLQIASAFLLFGLLQGLSSGVKQAISQAHEDRLYVGSRISLGDPLPIGMLPQIQRIRGVKLVTPLVQMPATYQTLAQDIPLDAVDPRAFFGIFTQYIVPAAALTAMQQDRTAMIIGSTLAKRYHIKAGERLALQSPQPRRDGSNAWVFDVVGIYDVPTQPNNAADALVNYDYVNQARVADRDTVLLYIALADSPAHGAAVGAAIDKAFANSSTETRTQSEGDLASSQLQRVVDLDYIVGAIMSAVFFALLFATGALLMQSIRERVPELAVLKTFGFSDFTVMALILTEALVFCVLAAAIGLALAGLLLPLARDEIGIASVPTSVFITGVLCAIGLAILGGTPPAWRGLKLEVAQALADRQ